MAELCIRLRGGVCRCKRASVAANFVCARLCGTFGTSCMHAFRADIACVAANVTAGNCVQACVAIIPLCV